MTNICVYEGNDLDSAAGLYIRLGDPTDRTHDDRAEIVVECEMDCWVILVRTGGDSSYTERVRIDRRD